jgi:hypothetical protein
VSQHKNSEDHLGRLSMWRAYGGATGVALVMNPEPFYSTVPSELLKVYASPVAYFDKLQFLEAFKEIVDNVENNFNFLQTLSREEIKGRLYRMLTFAAVCTKHPGFEEELEWRVVHFPWWQKSDYIKKEIENLNGVPQPVYKIPLEDVVDKNSNNISTGITIPSLLNHIIIGPTRDPVAMLDAFDELLRAAGVERAREKIVISDIPLRH